MIMRYLVLYIFVLLMFCQELSQAAVNAQVDRKEVALGESLTLQVVSTDANAESPDLSSLEPVFQVAHTGQTSSVQIVNGQMDKKTIWQVVLFPQTLGEQVIPPIEINGEVTRPIKINVVKPDSGAAGKGDFFIEIEPDKTEAYVQEEIGLTVRLFYRVTPRNAGLSEPAGKNLIVQPVNKSIQYTVDRKGTTYNVLERRYAIYAESSGLVKVNPVVFTGEIADTQRQSFSMFQRGRPVRYASDSIEFNIKPIPQSFIGKPWIPAESVVLNQNWSTANNYRVGEPITQTVELIVKGMSENQLPDIDLPTINGARIYPDAIENKTQQDGESLISTKVMKFAIIPEQAGHLQIPEFNLQWFNTKTQKPEYATINAKTLTIKPDEQVVKSQQSESTEITKSVDKNIAIKDAQEQVVIRQQPTDRWQWLSFLLLVLWLVTLFMWWRQRQLTVNGGVTTDDLLPFQNDKKLTDQLQSKEPVILQRAIIRWWNMHNSGVYRATNLTDIAKHQEYSEIADGLEQLQASLYAPNVEAPAVNWYEAIRKKKLVAKAIQTHHDVNKLPPLYQ